MRFNVLLSMAVMSALGLAAASGCSDDSDSGGTPAGGFGGNADQGGNGGESGSELGGNAGAVDKGGSGTGGAQTANGGSAGTTAATGGSSGGSGKLVQCKGTISTCADISSDKQEQYYGCCDGNLVHWCDDEKGPWGLRSADCAPQGKVCDYDTEFDSMYCVLPACTEGSCPSGQECINGVCSEPPCSATSCPDGQVCVNQKCINDPGPGPGPGPGPACSNLPAIQCTLGATQCGELVPFDPDNHPDAADYDPMLGYIDYPVNGESWTNQYRSYLRRDLMMLIKHATAFVACKANGWSGGNGKPLGLVDMSESNGAIPGTSINQPGHPAGTHTNGFDIDVAYYQNGTADNRAREVCSHTINGIEQNHCTATPHLLDVWRTALFIGALHDHPNLRVVGCDGKVGPMVKPAITKLCADGWLANDACSSSTLSLAYEETDQGYGWFLFHHHHMHVSFSKPSYPQPSPASPLCLVPGCAGRFAPQASY